VLAHHNEWIICRPRTKFHLASGIIGNSRKAYPHAPPSEAGMSKRRVLIVDDDVNLARLGSMILGNSGQYEVMIVNESVRALAAALQFRPDVMLLDVDMPEKDGGDLTREAANDSRLRNIPILFFPGSLATRKPEPRCCKAEGCHFWLNLWSRPFFSPR
jgi:CheY-like chemotaxis protein